LGAEALEVRCLLSGQTVQLIKDVNAVESYPSNLTPVGSNLFYVAEDSTDNGPELAVTNAQGTQVLKDFGSGSMGYSYGSLSELTGVGGSLFFLSESGSPQLWTSDGSTGGTAQITFPAGSSTTIGDLTAVGSGLIFDTSSSSPSGVDDQLWAASPGSTSATMIADFKTAPVSVIGWIGGTAYLSGGGNLWTTDGTATNTVPVKDSSNNAVPAPSDVFSFQGQVEYLSSGTTTSTIGVLGSGGETPTLTNLPASTTDPVVAGSLFYFATSSSSTAAQTRLWASDGTERGTRLLQDFSGISASSVPSNLVAANGSLFFTLPGSDGFNQLWTSDGTSQGTSLVKDLWIQGHYGGSYAGSYSGAGVLVPIGGTLYFTAFDTAHGAELWSNDVATGTTQLVTDINLGPDSSDPQDLVDLGGQLYFAANDGSSPLTSQLWTSGGTAGTTTRVATFSPGHTAGAAASLMTGSSYITLGSELLLPLNDGIRGTALWATDGTASGTQFLAPVNPLDFAPLNGSAYFLGSGAGSQFGLWQTNGTAGGTTEVKDLSHYGPLYGYNGGEMAASGARLFFATSDGSGGVDLWASDGTAGGTSIVKDFAPPAGSTGYGSPPVVTDLTPFAGKLAFVADNGTLGTQVWITDGTIGETQMLTDIAGSTGPYGASSTVDSLTVAGGRLYFFSSTPGVSSGLWSSDGTPGNTSEFVLPTLPSSNPLQPPVIPAAANLTAIGSALFFSLEYTIGNTAKPVDEYQLWTTIGADGGAAQVQPAGAASFLNLANFVALGDKLIFEAQSSGAEGLWTTDGTAGGTTDLKVINPAASPYGYYGPSQPLLSNGIIYFAADDGTHGDELWESDGKTSGTFMAADTNPGPSSSSPTPLAVLNNHLVLTADDGIHGTQLMELIPTAQNAPPVLATVPTQSATVGESFQLNFSLYAYDPNNPVLPLTYSLGPDAPPGMTIDPSSGLLSWPGWSDQTTGAHSFTVTVADNASPSQTASETLTINATAGAVQPPAVRAMPAQSITQGETLTFNAGSFAYDPNTPALPLTFSLGGIPPAGISINSSTGVVTWTTASGVPVGSHSLTIVATDNSSPPKSGGGTLTINVLAVQSPALSNSIPTQSAAVGQTLSFNLSPYATDQNTPALPLSFSLAASAPTGASLNPTTGVFQWTPPSNQASGPVTVTFEVSDSLTSSSPTQGSLTIDVTAVPHEQPPVVQSIPAQNATAGQAFQLNLSTDAMDPNTPPLSLSYSLGANAPAGASLNPTSGLFTWTPPANQAAGPVTINFSVGNTANLSTPGTFTIDVAPAVVIASPVIQPIPAQSATIGQPFALNIAAFASDPNTPPLPLTYGLGGGAPTGASINPTTGVFSWTPAVGQPTRATTITVDVSDNQSPPNRTSRSFTINVAAAAVVPPILRAVSQAASVDVGQSFTLNVSQLASDPNTPPLPLSYSLGAGAPAGMAINSATGVLTWNVPPNQRIGNDSATVIVADNSSPPKTASETLSFTVVDPSPPPTITSPKVSTRKGFSITLTFSQPVDPATAADANNYILTEPARIPTSKKKPMPPPTVLGMSVSYNQTTNQVTLKVAKKPKAHTGLTLKVVGSGPTGIAKLTGLQLAGSGGQPGTNYVAAIRGKRLTQTAAVTGNSIVVRTERPAHALARLGSASGGPGGPLAVTGRPFTRRPKVRG
jgi:ELWxxDGT repeat protein